jgi:site-specific DNA-cytosine methylase
MCKYSLISLFSGVSGSSLGFHNTGRINELLAVDCDPYVEKCFNLNFPGVPFWNAFLGKDSGKEILTMTGLQAGELDILFASPPCQGFSMARGSRSISDSRNDLLVDTIYIINDLKPKVFIIENVKGLISGAMKMKLNQALKLIEKINYKYAYKVLLASDYGVPQLRQRIILIGIRKDIGLLPTFPKPIISSDLSIKNYVDDIDFFTTGQYDNIIYKKDEICRTITATASLKFFKNGIKRDPTIDEIRKLCSFPANFILEPAAYDRQFKALGNSVPPKLMEAVANQVISILDNQGRNSPPPDKELSNDDLINKIRQAKRVVLLEPPYKRKYIPLGLAKIATFVKQNGGEIFYQRKYRPVNEDLVCVTSLFTWDKADVIRCLKNIYSYNENADVILGGVCATLLYARFKEEFPKLSIYKGYSKELDSYPPDYSIDWNLKDEWGKFSFVFSTRGCPNHCGYCAVPRLEPEMWINKNWKDHIDSSKPFVMISDNNLSAQPLNHLIDVCDYLKQNNKPVVFDNGFDCKHITDDLIHVLRGVKFYKKGMRLAFDRIEEDGIFQNAIMKLINGGIPKSSIMAYCLFNFTDTPQEADYRMRECVKLGIHPYPQQFTPLNNSSRKDKYVGKYWTENLVKCFRFYWLMSGYFQKYEFKDWIAHHSDINYRLSEADWDAWYYQDKIDKGVA